MSFQNYHSEGNELCVPIYYNICQQIRSFDLIAFGGQGLRSDPHYSIDDFSHVGMVVTSEILPNCKINNNIIYLNPGNIYILESPIEYNLDIVPHLIMGEGKMCVRLIDLKEVTSSSSRVAWCKLINNPLDRIHNESEECLKSRCEIISQRFRDIFSTYQMDLISLSASSFPFLHKVIDIIYYLLTIKKDDGYDDWQFCSELVANIYQAFDIIPEHIDPKNIRPEDFFGLDHDGLRIMVESPIFINDSSISEHPAISCSSVPTKRHNINHILCSTTYQD